MAKFDICENCRNNYPAQLGFSKKMKDILCENCKGLKSNYEPLRPAEHEKLGVK